MIVFIHISNDLFLLLKLEALICFFYMLICRGSNVKFDDDELLNRINCYCHILHNIVEHMCAAEPVKLIVDNVSSLVTYIRLSGLGNECKPQLKKFVETRWNTVHDMLESVSLNYAVIGKKLLEKEEADGRSDVMQKLTRIAKVDLDIRCEFLSKFKLWSKQLESDLQPNLWMVWPTFVSLNKYLADHNSDAFIVQQMKKVGREYVSNKMSVIEPKLVHKIGTVLHPMFKNIAIASSIQKNEVYGEIDRQIRKFPPPEQIEFVQPTGGSDILDDFMGHCESQNETNSDGYTDELQRHLDIKIPPSNPYDFNLLDWWFENRHTFKNLFKLFISKAGISASSAQAERSFSTNGIVIEAHRLCLLPDTVQNLVLARQKYLNFM